MHAHGDPPRFAAVLRRAGVDDPWALALPDVQFCWDDPLSGVRALGAGVVESLEAQGRQAWSLLDRATSPLGFPETSALPGPWWVGSAFDLERPPGEGWRGFPPFRLLLPRFLAWREAGETL